MSEYIVILGNIMKAFLSQLHAIDIRTLRLLVGYLSSISRRSRTALDFNWQKNLEKINLRGVFGKNFRRHFQDQQQKILGK